MIYATTPIETIDIDTFLKGWKKGEVSSTAYDEDLPATHFQFYYFLVFNKNRDKRFELKRESSACLQVKTGKDIRPDTLPPYRCGMVVVKDSSDDIEKE